ncbi:MAG: hypothetical protein KY475_01695 [Planctomycetes bacterium]|nr:hypothetical protein [Planctomycetota bacterium]
MTREQMGVATVSVDVNFDGPAGRDATVTRLLELLDRYAVPATWALPAPGKCTIAPRVLESGASHEIAILGDARWVGQTAGRGRFALELARRASEARDAGFTVRGLAVTGAQVPRDHYDLLVKHGISAVRQPRSVPGRRLRHLQPQSLRHGVMEIPPSAVVPESRRWLSRGAGRVAIVRAAAAAEVAHLVVDAARCATDDPRLRAVESALRDICRRCGDGTLRVATLDDLAEEATAAAPAVRARSILRAA